MLNKEVSKILDELSILTDQEYDRMLAIMQKERANRNLPVANLNSILFGDTDG
jgi:hypothetical protein